MSKQTGARYLHVRKNRKDESFNGIIKLVNRPIVKLASGAVKRVRNVKCS